MFENFSFQTASRSNAATHDPFLAAVQDDISPTSSRCASPCTLDRYKRPPPLSIADLSHHFSEYNIQPRNNARPPFPRSLPTPPADQPLFCEAESMPTSPVGPSQEMTHTSVRLQRQINTQLQCDPAHLKSLSALVEGMVSNGSQCYVRSPPTTSPPPSRDGASSEDDNEREREGWGRRRSVPNSGRWKVRKDPEMVYQKSTDWSSGQTYVAKTTRLRKSGRRPGPGRLDRPGR